MKFQLDTFWLSKDRLPYQAHSESGRVMAQYSITRNGSYEELAVMAGEYQSGYHHDNMLEYIVRKHKVNVKSAKITLQNGPWIFYKIKGFNWADHEKWAKPLIERERIDQLVDTLQEYSTKDLKRVINRRKGSKS